MQKNVGFQCLTPAPEDADADQNGHGNPQKKHIFKGYYKVLIEVL